MPATAVLLAKIADLEASLQSTENYWKSLYELEADKVATIQDERDRYFGYLQDKDLECETQRELKDKSWKEVEGFKSICNEYLCGPEASWQDLSNWCEDKTDEIVELKDEVEDLEEQVADLKEKHEVNIDDQLSLEEFRKA